MSRFDWALIATLTIVFAIGAGRLALIHIYILIACAIGMAVARGPRLGPKNDPGGDR